MTVYLQRWDLSYLDGRPEEAIAVENDLYRQAKRNAAKDNVLRFVCAFSAQVIKQLSGKHEWSHRPEMRRTLEEDLQKTRPVLDAFVAEKVGLEDAVAVLHPVVLDSLHYVPVVHVQSLIREALNSIMKIKI
ncbi:hypothetical protein HY463_01045 [Candidatus Peregrinibacteria bacterium]|nr:hypothetical protein [Candidatus Peregrinibacteria bacterium]